MNNQAGVAVGRNALVIKKTQLHYIWKARVKLQKLQTSNCNVTHRYKNLTDFSPDFGFVFHKLHWGFLESSLLVVKATFSKKIGLVFFYQNREWKNVSITVVILSILNPRICNFTGQTKFCWCEFRRINFLSFEDSYVWHYQNVLGPLTKICKNCISWNSVITIEFYLATDLAKV